MRTKEEVIAEVDKLNQEHSQLNSIDEAYFDIIIKESKRHKLQGELIHIYCDLANISFLTLGDYINANYYLSEARKALTKTDQIVAKARYYSVIGNFLRMKNDFPNAIKSIFLSIELLNNEEEKDNNVLKQLYNSNYSLAMIYNNLGENGKFESFVRTSETLAKRLGNKIMLANCLTQKSLIYCRKGKFSLAEKFSVNAVKLLQDSNSNYALGNAINQLGEVYFKQKKFENSLPLFEESVKILLNHNPNLNYCFEFLRLGENLMALKNKSRAFEMLKIAEQRSDLTFNKEIKLNVFKAIVDYYKWVKNYKDALIYSEKSQSLMNEIKILDNEKKALEIEEKYQSALKQKEINFRKKKQREAELYIELMEEQNKLTKNMIELLNKGLKNPVKNGKQMLDVLNRGGLNAENKTKIIKNIHEYFGQIEQFSKDVKEIIQSDSKEALGEKLDASRIISLVNKNLAGKTDEYDLDRSKYPKTYFIQEHVSRLAKNSEQSAKLFPLLQARSVGVLI